MSTFTASKGEVLHVRPIGPTRAIRRTLQTGTCHGNSFGWAVAVLLISGLACETPTDDSVAPDSELNQQGLSEAVEAVPGDPTGQMKADPAFLIDIDVQGNLTPESPIDLTFLTDALRPVGSTRFVLHAPELQAWFADGFGPDFSVPAGARLLPLVERTAAVVSGQSLTLAHTLRIPAPGYYRVVAKAASSDSTIVGGDGRWVRNSAVTTVWLWISEEGGKVTKRFDATLFPKGAVVAPGPLRFFDGADLRQSSSPESASIFGAAVGVLSSAINAVKAVFRADVAEEVTIEVLYWNVDLESYEPVSYAQWIARWTG